MTDETDGGGPGATRNSRADRPDMTRERARTERRDLDLERDWPTRPRILITNDDGVESRGLLALKQALDPIGDTVVVAPDTNQSAVGHQKTLMRPLRVRERTLAGGWLADGCGQPRLPRLLR